MVCESWTHRGRRGGVDLVFILASDGRLPQRCSGSGRSWQTGLYGQAIRGVSLRCEGHVYARHRNRHARIRELGVPLRRRLSELR